jgi:hypothetical protein
VTDIWATVQQPILFPPIYMMERFARCHDVVVLDAAQFDRDNTQFLLMFQHGPVMQSVQLEAADHKMLFRDRRVMRGDVWARKLLQTAQTVYGKRAHFKEHSGWFNRTVTKMAHETDLTAFCLTSVMAVAELLGMTTNFFLGSAMVTQRDPDPTAWLVQLCSQLQCTDYIQGERSMRNYFVSGPFENADIRTWGQRFDVEYQSTGRAGNGGMSILDLLFTEGVDHAREILMVDRGAGPRGTEILVTR